MIAESAVRCGAHGKRSGQPCRGLAMKNGRCRVHGGLSVAGAAAGGFKTGRYSKYMPKRLLARYEEALGDPNLLSLSDELAVVDARAQDLIAQLGTGESPKAWLAAGGAVKALIAELGRDEPDQEMVKATLGRLEDIVRQGMGDIPIWDAAAELFETRRRLADTERKRLEAMQATITAEQALAFVQAVLNVVQQRVSDPVELQAITTDLARLAGLGFTRATAIRG